MYLRFLLLMVFISSFNSLDAQELYSLSGKVEDPDGTPLAGANVYIPDLYKGISTGADGSYAIDLLHPGKYTLQISFIGYQVWIDEIVVRDRDISLNAILEPTVFQSEVVVISGGRPTSQHENAIKIESVPLSEIQLAGSPSLMQSISQVPGVDLIGMGNAVATPVIRGLSTSNILVLDNGVRLENYQFSENHPYLIDEFGIDQVEVIKGPASLLYGSDAIGGVLNFIKERPAPVGSISGDANLQYHSNTNGYNANLGIKGSSRKIFWGLRGGLKSHMDFLDGNGTYIPNTRFNQESIKSFLGFNSSAGIFRIYYDYIKINPGMCVQPAIQLVPERGRKNEVWYQDLDMHIITSRNTFFLKALKLEANLSYQHNHRRLKGSPDNPPMTMVDAKLNTINYEVKTSFALNNRSNYIISLQGMSQHNTNQEAPEHVLPDYSLNDFSLSGLFQYDFKPNVHFQVGLRYDNRFLFIPGQVVHSHGHGGEHGDEDEEVFEELDEYYGNVSGSVGLTVTLKEKLSMRFNVASAYRTPNVAELSQDGQHGARYEQGNRDMNSQRNYEADISLHYHSKRFLFDIAGFYNYVDQYIYLAPTSDTTEDGDIIYRYAQNDATLYGLEAISEVLIVHNLGIKATYSHIRGKQPDGTDLPFIPHNRLNLELKWSKSDIWILKNFYVKAGTGIAFKQDHPSPFETSTPGYTLVNAGLGLVVPLFGQQIELDIIASNLTNVVYQDHLSTIKSLGYNNPGMNIMVNLRVPFSFVM